LKNYAEQIQKAFVLASGIFYPEVVTKERALAKDYDESKRNQAIILYNEESNGILRLPYFYRLKPEYARIVRRKIWGYIYPQIKDCNDSVVLTLDASTSNYYSQSDAHEKNQWFWNILLTRIRKRYPHVKIIKAVEWQENGLGYHLHVLIVGIRFLPKDWIAKTWSKLEKSGWSIQLERGFDNPKRALAYLLKYITKNLRNGDEIPISLVVNWALRLRTIAVSRSFSFNKSNSNQKWVQRWVLLGFMPWDSALIMSDSEILAYFGVEKPVLLGIEPIESRALCVSLAWFGRESVRNFSLWVPFEVRCDLWDCV
jgi:hypothetical protein